MKKGPFTYVGPPQRQYVYCTTPWPQKACPFLRPRCQFLNLGPLFPLMTGPRAAASRKNWGPLPASTLQHRPMN